MTSPIWSIHREQLGNQKVKNKLPYKFINNKHSGIQCPHRGAVISWVFKDQGQFIMNFYPILVINGASAIFPIRRMMLRVNPSFTYSLFQPFSLLILSL
jgi:hypothetical protein